MSKGLRCGGREKGEGEREREEEEEEEEAKSFESVDFGPWRFKGEGVGILRLDFGGI